MTLDTENPAEELESPENRALVFENKLKTSAGPLLYWASGLSGISKLYKEVVTNYPPKDFVHGVLERLNIQINVSDEALNNIPKTGPVIVVANHPFGGIEGLVLVEMLSRVRPDVRLMANYLLSYIPELRQHFISVDPFGSSNSVKANISSLRESMGWLKGGGLLASFPAGTVSYLHPTKCEVTDPEWNRNLAGIIRRTHAPVVPIFIHGRNGFFFQLMGLIHPKLRTALLAREFINKKGNSISLDIGNPISNEKLARFTTDNEMLDYLRLRTFILRHKTSTVEEEVEQDKSQNNFEVIVDPQDPDLLEKEISALPPHQKLLSDTDTDVYYAYATQIPACMYEIGRLREVSFRAANEGTGKSLDLDRFDDYYIHLFSWHRENREIVGAYRIAKTDQVVEQHGITGLYTHTLFKYTPTLIEQLGPSLELGRSFIRVEYQRSYTSLLLLWRGIGQFVAQNVKYKNLFGPVSISNEYDSVSRQLIVSFLRSNNFLPHLAKQVKPRNAHRNMRIKGVDHEILSKVVRDINDISQFIAEIEAKESAIPVLLKQYLKLGGKLLGFNLDPDFGNVLDGLILVDLAETPEKMLSRYLGTGAKEFLAYHKNAATSVLEQSIA